MMLYLFLLLKSFKLETKFIDIQQDTPTITGLIPAEQILKYFRYCSKVLEYGIHYPSTSKMLRPSVYSSIRVGRDFDRSLWPRGRAFELSCCPRGRDIWIFVRARDHKSFPGWGISVKFDFTFLPGVGNLTAIFWKMSKSRPMPRLPPPPLAGLTSIGA